MSCPLCTFPILPIHYSPHLTTPFLVGPRQPNLSVTILILRSSPADQILPVPCSPVESLPASPNHAVRRDSRPRRSKPCLPHHSSPFLAFPLRLRDHPFLPYQSAPLSSRPVIVQSPTLPSCRLQLRENVLTDFRKFVDVDYGVTPTAKLAALSFDNCRPRFSVSKRIYSHSEAFTPKG